MGRVITDTEGKEAFELWLRAFLPQLFDENFVLEPGESLECLHSLIIAAMN